MDCSALLEKEEKENVLRNTKLEKNASPTTNVVLIIAVLDPLITKSVLKMLTPEKAVLLLQIQLLLDVLLDVILLPTNVLMELLVMSALPMLIVLNP